MHTHHAFDYIEMSAPNLDALRAFYEAAFGMSFTEYGPDYLGMSMEGREIGGLERGPFRGKGGPLVVLYSKDIDASLASIESAGGARPDGRRCRGPAGSAVARH